MSMRRALQRLTVAVIAGGVLLSLGCAAAAGSGERGGTGTWRSVVIGPPLTEAEKESLDAIESASRLRAVFEENYAILQEADHKIEDRREEALLDSFFFGLSIQEYNQMDRARRVLRQLGPRAIPLLVEKEEKDPNFPHRTIAHLAFGLAGLGYESWDAMGRDDLTPSEWFRLGQSWMTARTKALWDAGDRDSVHLLGIATLPFLMERLREGDREALPVIVAVVGRQRTRTRHFSLGPTGRPPVDSPEACLTWWEKSKSWWLIPFPDQRGLATDQTGKSH